MTTRNGKTPDEPTIAEFNTSLRGALIRPDDNGYDTARKIHNAMIDRRPDFIVRCAGVADVIGAVNFARSHNLLVAIRGTGHNVAGTSLLRWRSGYRSLANEIGADRSPGSQGARRRRRLVGRAEPRPSGFRARRYGRLYFDNRRLGPDLGRRARLAGAQA